VSFTIGFPLLERVTIFAASDDDIFGAMSDILMAEFVSFYEGIVPLLISVIFIAFIRLNESVIGILPILTSKAQILINRDASGSPDAIAGSTCGEGPSTIKRVGLFSVIVGSTSEGYDLPSNGI